MLGRTHSVVGLFFSLIITILFDISNPWLFTFLLLFGSWLPDIDILLSKFVKTAGGASWIFKHRGFFHSIPALIIFSFLVFVVFNSFTAFALGFFIHLFLDAFTKKGVSFFVFDKRIRGSFITGGWMDNFLLVLFLFSDLYLLIIILL